MYSDVPDSTTSIDVYVRGEIIYIIDVMMYTVVQHIVYCLICLILYITIWLISLLPVICLTYNY